MKMCKNLIAADQVLPAECPMRSKRCGAARNRCAARDPRALQLKRLEQIECEAAKYLASSSGNLLANAEGM